MTRVIFPSCVRAYCPKYIYCGQLSSNNCNFQGQERLNVRYMYVLQILGGYWRLYFVTSLNWQDFWTVKTSNFDKIVDRKMIGSTAISILWISECSPPADQTWCSIHNTPIKNLDVEIQLMGDSLFLIWPQNQLFFSCEISEVWIWYFIF